MLSSKENCRAILAMQRGLKGLTGSIITSNKQQQLCIISCLVTDVETEGICADRGGRKWDFLFQR